MTKARDIASASPAPSTVSATELGYLDGVSSAIQTQIDSKIGSASAINPTIVDAKGDLLVGSAADTVARLAVGTNDYVLTADSAATNGVKWAAPAGGGGLTFISRTTFSNVASQAFDDVFTSSYYSYIAKIEYLYAATNTDDLQLQFRYAGPTTQTTGYYGSTFEVIYNGVTTVYGANNASAGTLGGQEIGASPQGTTAIINFNGVGNQSEVPTYYGQSSNFPGSGMTIFNGITVTNRTYTGFLLKSTSSNITGAVSIYGLAKS